MGRDTHPLIGINADFVPASKTNSAHARLNIGYLDAIVAAGGLPVVIPPLAKEEELEAILDRVEGIVFSGGLDIDPKRTGGVTHPAVQPMAPRREDADAVLMRRALDRRMAILGIGLGMQQLNVACGGTLHLHLPEHMPKSLPHFDPSGGPHRHTVLLEAGTRIDEIYGGGEIRVNSAHHQGVAQVGGRLRVGALAPDGVIEAIESVDPNWFCIGVQWHPESESASALDMQLFECFVQACVRQEQALELAA